MLNFFKKNKDREILYKRDSTKPTPKEKRNFEELRKHSKLKKKHWFHFIIKLFTIMSKNYKLLIRSRSSALIFFFGPLLIIFLVGMGFNTSFLTGISVATYSESYSPLTESLISNLSSTNFKVTKSASLEDCINSVKFGSLQMCIMFPKDMVLDNSAKNNIEIYVDDSRMNLANQIIKTLDTKVEIQAEELSSSLVNQMLVSLDAINKQTTIGKNKLKNLEQSTSNIDVGLSSVSSDLDEFDFDFTTFDSSPVTKELKSIRTALNLSSTYFSDVEDALDVLKDQYNSIAGKLEEAEIQSQNIKTDISSVSTNIAQTQAHIKEMNDLLDEVKGKISEVKITNVENIVSPIKTQIKPLSSKKNYLAYTFPTLLVLLIMFVALLMSSTTIVREKKSMAFFRNFITPTFNGLFIIGQYLSDLTIIFLQIAIIFGVSAIFLKGFTWQIYLIAGGVMLILASIFIFIGMILGYLFNTEESVTTSAVSVAIIFLLFSNAILPMETLSGFLRNIVLYNPFVVGERILKWFMLFESNFSVIYKPLLILIIWLILVMIITVITAMIAKRFKK